MSMTREGAIINLEKLIALFHTASEQSTMVDYSKIIETLEFAIAALRPIGREQVEKVWRGEWRLLDDCANEGLYCSQCGKKVYRAEYANVKMTTRFCPNCMSAMTDEAVQMVMERMEALKDGKDD